MANRSPLVTRFWLRIDRRELDACWNWLGAKTTQGYGYLYERGERGDKTNKKIYAHILSYRIHYKYTPEVVRHKCQNPSCVNPNHLLAGSHYDNVQDTIRDRRKAGLTKMGSAKLYDEQVYEIKRRLKYEWRWGLVSALAREYNVSPSTISLIKLGKIFQDVVL